MLRRRRCAKSGPGRPIAPSVTRLNPTSRPKLALIADCAGACSESHLIVQRRFPGHSRASRYPDETADVALALGPRIHGDERTRNTSGVKPCVAVVIPTFNEAESIGAVVAGLPRDIVNRVIVADGGSSDGTRERAQTAGRGKITVSRGYRLGGVAHA